MRYLTGLLLGTALFHAVAEPAGAQGSGDAMSPRATLEAAWAAFGEGDFDRLVGHFAEDMIFVMPGQDDVLAGRDAFRTALDGIGDALPPGFAVTGLRYFEGDNEIVNVAAWTADKVPGGSQLAILFRFDANGKIAEERWFVDTEQWRAAF